MGRVQRRRIPSIQRLRVYIMCFGSSKAPTQALPPPPIQAQDEAISQAGDAERRRRAAASGRQSTILSGPQGAGQAQTTGNTLFGS